MVWRRVLGAAPQGDDGFFDLGGDSLDAVRLVAELQHEFGIELSPAVVYTAQTVAGMATALRLSAPRQEATCLVPMRATVQTRRPPVLFAHALSGSVSTVARIARRLPSGYNVFGLQARGLDPHAEAHRTIEAMAAHYVAEIQAALPPGPRILVGYSMGASVALEMARIWRAERHPVTLISLDGHARPPLPTTRERPTMNERIELVSRHLGVRPPDAFAPGMTYQEKLRALLDACRAQAVVLPYENTLRQLDRLVALRALHLDALSRFQPGPLDVHITLLRSGMSTDPLDWDGIAVDGVDVVPVPGDHFAITTRYAPMVARRLTARLKRLHTTPADRELVTLPGGLSR